MISLSRRDVQVCTEYARRGSRYRESIQASILAPPTPCSVHIILRSVSKVQFDATGSGARSSAVVPFLALRSGPGVLGWRGPWSGLEEDRQLSESQPTTFNSRPEVLSGGGDPTACTFTCYSRRLFWETKTPRDRFECSGMRLVFSKGKKERVVGCQRSGTHWP